MTIRPVILLSLLALTGPSEASAQDRTFVEKDECVRGYESATAQIQSSAGPLVLTFETCPLTAAVIGERITAEWAGGTRRQVLREGAGSTRAPQYEAIELEKARGEGFVVHGPCGGYQRAYDQRCHTEWNWDATQQHWSASPTTVSSECMDREGAFYQAARDGAFDLALQLYGGAPCDAHHDPVPPRLLALAQSAHTAMKRQPSDAERIAMEVVRLTTYPHRHISGQGDAYCLSSPAIHRNTAGIPVNRASNSHAILKPECLGSAVLGVPHTEEWALIIAGFAAALSVSEPAVAVNIASQVLTFWPDHTEALLALADALYEQRRTKEAVSRYRRYLELADPANVPSRVSVRARERW